MIYANRGTQMWGGRTYGGRDDFCSESYISITAILNRTLSSGNDILLFEKKKTRGRGRAEIII